MGKPVTTGGEKTEKWLKKAKDAPHGYDVGFFPGAAYDDGTPVVEVAFKNEFGQGNIPERPFFRRANKVMERSLAGLVKKAAKDGMITDGTVKKIASAHQGAVQESIIDLKDPPNSAQTIAMKGSSNPLVDTGLLGSSVTFEVKK